MNRKLVWLLAVLLLASLHLAEAQQPKKVHRIGYLEGTLPSGSAHLLEVLRQRMRDLGWIEGKNVAFEYRFAEDKGNDASNNSLRNWFSSK